MHGQNAFKLGTILLLLGFAVSAAQVTSEAQVVTSLEAQRQDQKQVQAQQAVPAAQERQPQSIVIQPDPSKDETNKGDSEKSAPESAPESNAKADAESLMKALGVNRQLQQETQAAHEVEQINVGKFQPFQVGN
jgi:hypothetical protein